MTDEPEPWYHGGLRFHCTMCGHCCTGTPGYVWVSDAEVAAIAKFVGMPEPELLAVHTRLARGARSLRERDNGDCVFYDKSAGCTIYSVRPAQCRTWPFWETNLETSNDWQRTCDVCPGSGHGDLIPVEEITRRLNVVRL